MPFLYRLAWFLVDNERETSQVVLSALVKGIQRAAWRPESVRLSPWLGRMVVWQAQPPPARRGQQHRQGAGREAGGPAASLPDWSDRLAETGFRTDMRDRLAAGIRRLPWTLRPAWVLADIETCSLEESCQLLDLSPAAATSRVRRGRAVLRAELHRHATGETAPPPRDDPPAACLEATPLLHASLEGDLPADQRKSLDSHLSGCPPCAALASTSRCVRELAGELRTMPVPPDLHLGLPEALALANAARAEGKDPGEQGQETGRNQEGGPGIQVHRADEPEGRPR